MSNCKLPDDAGLRHLVAKGLGRRNIAALRGCSLSAVESRLKRLGLVAPLETPPLPPEPDRMVIPKWSMPRLSGPVSLPCVSLQALPFERIRG